MLHPDDRRYAKSHEWFMAAGNIVTVGITPYAADELTDITYVELPKLGKSVQAGEACGEIESVKATAELFCAVSGTITAVNTKLSERPELLNSDALVQGWIFKLQASNLTELDKLMTAEAYNTFIDAA